MNEAKGRAIVELLPTGAKCFVQAEIKYVSNLNGSKFGDPAWCGEKP